MSNVLKFTGSKDLSRDDVIDQLERCQMAASVIIPAERFEVILVQLLRYMDSQLSAPKPDSE